MRTIFTYRPFVKYYLTLCHGLYERKDGKETAGEVVMYSKWIYVLYKAPVGWINREIHRSLKFDRRGRYRWLEAWVAVEEWWDREDIRLPEKLPDVSVPCRITRSVAGAFLEIYCNTDRCKMRFTWYSIIKNISITSLTAKWNNSICAVFQKELLIENILCMFVIYNISIISLI